MVHLQMVYTCKELFYLPQRPKTFYSLIPTLMHSQIYRHIWTDGSGLLNVTF